MAICHLLLTLSSLVQRGAMSGPTTMGLTEVSHGLRNFGAGFDWLSAIISVLVGGCEASGWE